MKGEYCCGAFMPAMCSITMNNIPTAYAWNCFTKNGFVTTLPKHPGVGSNLR